MENKEKEFRSIITRKLTRLEKQKEEIIQDIEKITNNVKKEILPEFGITREIAILDQILAKIKIIKELEDEYLNIYEII